jgi:hypothetical protein
MPSWRLRRRCRLLSDDESPRLSLTGFNYILIDVVTFRTFECAQIAAPWVTGFDAYKHHCSVALRAGFHFGKQRRVSTSICHKGCLFYDRLLCFAGEKHEAVMAIEAAVLP